MPKEYSLEDRMAGRDLHGLPCRVPEPTEEQAKCSHTRREVVEYGYEQDWDGEMIPCRRTMEVDAMEDIPGTNNLRCTICGYTRRY